ncbi:MAG: DnaJ domain-containing protein [Armatimonadota bacterium]|nr:DnaJ domain-containing protein [Armatimonadota bacterium]
MRSQRDYYEILGVPSTATMAEIKHRYRELARKFHPDVVKDKAFGHRAFAQITEAYGVLSDPDKRRDYDAARASSTSPRPASETRRPSAGSSQTRAPDARPPSPPTGRPADPGRLVRDAEFAFISGRLGAATNLCRQAIRQNQSNARAHAILGDIYRIQGKKEQAIIEYGYAVQFNPSDHNSQAKLEKLLRPKGSPRRPSAQSNRSRRGSSVDYSEEIRSARNTANMIGWGLAFFLLFLINVYPGIPIEGLKIILPVISMWSWNMVALLALDAALVGFLLGVNRVISHPDDELMFLYIPGTMIPIGFPLLLFSTVFFYAAAGLSTLLSLLQGYFSKSLAIVFAAVMLITLLASLMYEPGRASVVLFGGNIAFPAMVIGWYIGSLFGPIEK